MLEYNSGAVFSACRLLVRHSMLDRACRKHLPVYVLKAVLIR